MFSEYLACLLKIKVLAEGLVIEIADVSVVGQLAPLARATFVNSFGKYNTREDMAHYLKEEMTNEKLASEFVDGKNVFFVAWLHGVLAGFAKVRTGFHIDAPVNYQSVEIERLYVAVDYQSKNIGAALMESCISLARHHQCNAIWLGVWEHNYRAIAFYHRQGFWLFGAHNFLLGFDLQTDVLMMREVD